MATTEQSDDSSDASIEKSEDNPTLYIKAEGEATRYRGRNDESVNYVATDKVYVDLTIEKTTETVFREWHKSRSHGNPTWGTAMENNTLSVLKEWVEEELSKDSVEVDYTTFKDEWDVLFDGDVRAWLDLFEQFSDSDRIQHNRATEIASNDCFGDGFEAALIELERRR